MALPVTQAAARANSLEAVWERFKEQSENVGELGSNEGTVEFWDRRRGHRGQKIRVPLPDSLDDDARMMFKHGHCHSLALALHNEGYPMVGAVSKYTETEFREVKTSHFFVLDPRDTSYGIDIMGRRPVEEILGEYPNTVLYQVANPKKTMKLVAEEGTYVSADLGAGRRALGWLKDAGEVK